MNSLRDKFKKIIVGIYNNYYKSLSGDKRKKLRLAIISIIGATILLIIYLVYKSQFITLYGNVDIRSVNASFRVGGRIEKVLVDEGSVVSTGQKLAKIDDVPHKLNYEQAKANFDGIEARNQLVLSGHRSEDIEQARASVDVRKAAFHESRKVYQRQKSLFKSNVTNKQALDSSKSAFEQAKASLDQAKAQYQVVSNGFRSEEIEESSAHARAAKAALELAKLQLDDATLKSPNNGIILTRVVEPGTIVSAGAPVFVLQLREPLWIRAYISEPDLGNVSLGKKVTVINDGGYKYTGTIGFISPQSEFTPKSVETPDFRTSLVYRLRIIVDEIDSHLQQGMPVTITFKK